VSEQFIKYPHYLNYEAEDLKNVTLGFTTRDGGYSLYPEHSFNMARYIDDNQDNVTQHQEILAKAIGYPRNEWIFPIQTHEDKIAYVTQQHQGTNIEQLSDQLHGIDGLYSYDSNVLLTMCYADCVPIYFYSEKHHFIGLAHAGWRGTYSQIVVKMLNHVDFNYKDLKVVIGPSTSMSYEINDDIKSKFETLPIDSTQYIETRDKDRHGIDLKRANALLLEDKGVPKDNIYITDYATSEDLSMFFSYRIEKGQTGRMMGFIGQKY